MCLNGKHFSVRLTLVYGPQENDSEDKDSFYHDISVQVEMAYLNGALSSWLEISMQSWSMM